jgi:hypothetical protein
VLFEVQAIVTSVSVVPNVKLPVILSIALFAFLIASKSNAALAFATANLASSLTNLANTEAGTKFASS